MRRLLEESRAAALVVRRISIGLVGLICLGVFFLFGDDQLPDSAFFVVFLAAGGVSVWWFYYFERHEDHWQEKRLMRKHWNAGFHQGEPRTLVWWMSRPVRRVLYRRSLRRRRRRSSI